MPFVLLVGRGLVLRRYPQIDRSAFHAFATILEPTSRLSHIVEELTGSGFAARIGSRRSGKVPSLSLRGRRKPCRRKRRNLLRLPLNHLSRIAGLRSQHFLDPRNSLLKLLVSKVLNPAGVLDLHLSRHQHCADFQIAGRLSRRTRLNTSRPCCCQSSARSSRKRLLNARRVASGEPPGFPETPGRYWPLALRSLRRARGMASWF